MSTKENCNFLLTNFKYVSVSLSTKAIQNIIPTFSDEIHKLEFNNKQYLLNIMLFVK